MGLILHRFGQPLSNTYSKEMAMKKILYLTPLLVLPAFLAWGQAARELPMLGVDQDHRICVRDGGTKICPLEVDGTDASVNITQPNAAGKGLTVNNSNASNTDDVLDVQDEGTSILQVMNDGEVRTTRDADGASIRMDNTDQPVQTYRIDGAGGALRNYFHRINTGGVTSFQDFATVGYASGGRVLVVGCDGSNGPSNDYTYVAVGYWSCDGNSGASNCSFTVEEKNDPNGLVQLNFEQLTDFTWALDSNNAAFNIFCVWIESLGSSGARASITWSL